MQLPGDRIVAPKDLMIQEITLNDSCTVITLDRTLFLRKGETLWLDGIQPVIERLDGTTLRPTHTTATVNRTYKLL